MDDKALGRKIFLSQVKVTLGPEAAESKYGPVRRGVRHKYTVRYKGKQFTSFCRINDPKLDFATEQNKTAVLQGVIREWQRPPCAYNPFSKADRENRLLSERLKDGLKRVFGADLDMVIDLFGSGGN
jgi:hypothetical protein